MGYVIEFRNESEKEDMIQKLHKAKKAVCEALEAMEDADNSMSERGRYRGGNYRDDMDYRRNVSMRDDDMDYRRGRYY